MTVIKSKGEILLCSECGGSGRSGSERCLECLGSGRMVRCIVEREELVPFEHAFHDETATAAKGAVPAGELQPQLLEMIRGGNGAATDRLSVILPELCSADEAGLLSEQLHAALHSVLAGVDLNDEQACRLACAELGAAI